MPHYYSEKQDSPLRINKFKAKLLGLDFEFYTASGIFSKRKIDRGTEVLIKNCIVKDNSRVLDYGCGYGAVGIAVAKAFPATEVILTDINKRAIKIAKMNTELNTADNAEVLYINKFEMEKKDFDTVLLNPPQTAGKEVCFEMIKKSKKYLRKGGNLQLVARHKKGGKELEKFMGIVFGNVKETAKKSGYRVYLSKN